MFAVGDLTDDRYKLALLGAGSQMFTGFTEKHDVVPLGFGLPLVVFAEALVGGDPHLVDLSSTVGLPGFWIGSKPSNQNDLIKHRILPPLGALLEV